jgi:regulator of replication initiation timing
MAKKISSSDLFEQEDLFKGVRDSASKTLAVFNELQAELKATAQGLKTELAANTQASTAQLKQFSAASEQANKLMQQAVQIEKLKAQADQQKIKAEQEIVKLQKMQAQETARLAKEQEKAAKLAANEASAYSKLSAELNKARKAYKDLAVQNQENSAEGKELLDTVTRLDAQLKKVDATVGQHQRNVGNYGEATKSLKLQLRELTQALQNMDASDPQFQEMAQRAGELKDQISDTQAVVKATAGSAMENFAGATAKAGQIGVAAFQGVEASMQLLGVENENVLEGMRRLQALAGLGDALKTLGGLGDTLTEIRAGFAATISKLGLFTSAQNTATTAIKAQNAAAAAGGGSFTKMGAAAKTALNGIKTGLISTGIGALVVALGLVVAYWDDIKEAVFGVSAEQKKLNDLSTKNQKVAEKTLENYENQENILKLQGKTDKEILKGKIVLQEEVVKANKANLLGLEATTKAEIAASRMREHALLFQFKMYKYLIGVALDFATKPIDLFIDKVNSIADSVGIGKLITFNTADIKKSAIGAVEAVEGTFKSVFTSIGLIADQNALTKSIDDAKTKLLISENELAGSKLALREMDIQSGKELVKSEQNNAKEQINIDRQLMDEKLRIMEDGFDKEYAILKEKRKRDKEDALKQLKEGVLSQKDYDRLLLQIDESFEADRKKLYETSADERMKTLEPDTAMFKKGQKEEIDLLMQGEAEKAAKRKETKEKEIEDNKKLEEEKWQTTQEFAQKATDYLKKQSDERISLIDKEISAAEKQADIYRTLAANGNINAKESLAEQERIIAEGNRRKEREQKRQQRMELANTIYQTYASHAAKDPKTALMNTIKDASLLQAFISSLPMFYDGTEDTGAGGGVDGKGGFHAVLHPHERVIPKSLNDQIGNLTNEQLTRLAMEYQNGRLVGQDVAHSSMDLAILVNEMKDLKEIIKHKPETNIQLGEITQSAMEIVQSTRKGNTTVYNRFKVRK